MVCLVASFFLLLIAHAVVLMALCLLSRYQCMVIMYFIHEMEEDGRMEVENGRERERVSAWSIE